MTAPAPDAAPRGGVIFWAGVLAFVVADLVAAFAGGLIAAVPGGAGPSVMMYVLLTGFALCSAVAVSVVVAAVRRRRAPPIRDAIRAAVALLLVVAHAALLVATRTRMG